MATPAIKPLVPTAALTNAAATYYTMAGANDNSVAQVTSLVISNTDSAAHAVTIYNVPKGGSAAVSNQVFPATSIPANTAWMPSAPGGGELWVVPNGGTIQALADASSKVNLTVGGREYV